MSKGFTLLMVTFLGLLRASAVAAPQSESAPVSVVKVQVVSHAGSPQLVLRLKNDSPKAIEAIVVVVEFFDGRGSSLGKATFSECADMLARSTLAEPGAEWELDPRPLPPGADAGQTSYRPRVDFVRFPDGTQWGPDEEKQSLHFAGLRLGVTATRQYLKMLLRERGIQAVVEELQR